LKKEPLKTSIINIPIDMAESAILKTGSKKVNSSPPTQGKKDGHVHVAIGN
jgi:hypothetical protein